MKILVGCEESQAVTIAFRKRGFEAYSCDKQPCSGGHPEWHLQMDVFKAIEGGELITESGAVVMVNKWTAAIFHPTCTFMSRAGARFMHPGGLPNIDAKRFEKAMQGKQFFMDLLNSKIEFIGVENPTPLKCVGLPKETQVIQPYEYGHNFSKRTLLWLKGFPKLAPTDIKKDYVPYLPSNTGGGKRGQKATFRNISQKDSSKTFPGIAEAMAQQWGDFLLTKNQSHDTIRTL